MVYQVGWSNPGISQVVAIEKEIFDKREYCAAVPRFDIHNVTRGFLPKSGTSVIKKRDIEENVANKAGFSKILFGNRDFGGLSES